MALKAYAVCFLAILALQQLCHVAWAVRRHFDDGYSVPEEHPHKRPTSEFRPDSKFYGFAYTVLTNERNYVGEKCRPPAAIRQDIFLMSNYASNIRLYDVSNCNAAKYVMRYAEEFGMKVSLCLWIDDPDEEHHLDSFRKDFKELRSLVEANVSLKSVSTIFVGSEVLYRAASNRKTNKVRPKFLQRLMKVKRYIQDRNLNISVGTTGVRTANDPDVISIVDTIGVNSFGYWERKDPVTSGLAIFDLLRRHQLKNRDKKVVLSEVGWPTNETAYGNSEKEFKLRYEASPQHALQYIKAYMANMRNHPIFHFQFRDTPWREFGERHWGLLQYDGPSSAGDMKPYYQQELFPGIQLDRLKRYYRNYLYQRKVWVDPDAITAIE